ncbi:similar to dicer-like protein 1 [Plenodomus lingam JN3]|uniref:Dicer-like protein 1 n=1 Tax=Leptosphaeria maculans (strain JN3 / isolate v23.1.3 / race Av1-4-5-6-7-8) TaxID=985895 RepID=E4ZRW0_LEPMJ|nr:similar to dicer-like protein 1 [Plenodomus lingam JN3]CBX93957.1 similar to dicer-like protein 1 [Plenodomus lingam JN3]
MVWAQVDEEQDDYFECEETSVTSTSGDEAEAVPKNDFQSEEEDSDLEDNTGRAHGPRTTTERRRAQNEVLKAYAANISAYITQQEVQAVSSKNAKEEQLSIREILAKQETAKRITNPRDYQTELFLRAKDQNTIAVLDTGSGKTHIATLLLRHVLEDELEHRATGGAPRIAIFLVDSVNLVFQQANVLKCGLDQNVESICGSMGTSLWNKSTWDKHFQKNMVIVCTAEVLVQCVMHSFITMAQINLLIFDEAHHAKNNHPYARIMKDYYVQELNLSKRPRIFGMTASPIDVRGLSSDHIKQAASDLEKLLHAKIATIDPEKLINNSISRPDEEIAVYPRLESTHETPLHQAIKDKYGDITAFQKFFIASKRHLLELGPWASDMYWSFAFAEEQSRKLQQREEFKYNKAKLDDSQQEWDAKVKRLKEAAEFVQQYTMETESISDSDLSSKVRLLRYWLNLYYERTDEPRCIVFVEKRETARLLKLIFERIGGPNLHCGMLVGVNNRAGEESISLRNQILAVSSFRRGELNCIFATSVAEEGLDIPQCNLVVRFDLYRTMIGYVQSRGRARHTNSKYLHMLEDGNHDHRQRVMDVRSDEVVMRQFCQSLSQDRRIDGSDEDGNDLLALSEILFPYYTDPKSGARLTYRSSLSILNHFIAVIPSPNRETMVQPTYIIRPATNYDPRNPLRSGFICEVILPEYAPIISITGKIESKKLIAKCSAAFMMCLELRKRGYLDENLLPTLHRLAPARRNALLAVSEKKKGNYPMLIKPSFWKQGRDTVPDQLYLTVINVDAGLDRPHQPLGLLTRRQFPQLPSFPIYLADGRPSHIVSKSIPTVLPVPSEILEMITKFTLRIYEDIYNKQYEYNIQKISYWVVPVLSDQIHKSPSGTNIEDMLDMEQIRRVYKNPTWDWTPTVYPEDLIDKYYIDPMNGGRRYYSNCIASHLTPQDPVPAHVPKQNQKYMNTILDYTDSRWARSRDTSRWDPSQPVLEVEKIPFRRNHLARVEEKEQKELFELKNYVCPQPLKISNIATPFVVMCYVLPAIIHRFESYLIALDACEVLDLHVSPALALEALTKDSENTDEHEEEKINFKSGMGPNYERLEFLGDCFLKMATSLSVFVQQPEENEFEYHVRRMLMLCNQNLMETAIGVKKVARPDGTEINLELPKYVRTEAFSRRTWYPEALKLIRGKGINKSEDDWLKLRHNLGDKSVADVCEAFIGAAFMEHHKHGLWIPSQWDLAVKAVKLFANNPDHSMEKWTDYYAAYVKPKYQLDQPTAAMLDAARQIEAVHPYHFKYPRLVRSAFTHPSYAYMFEHIPNYQRLEFLGDSLLDMAFIMHLYYKYPDKDPQWLTEHKTPMVSNKFLGAVCVKLGWHRHLKSNTAILSTQIRDYVLEIDEAEREANGAVDYWVNVHEPPKCLADVIEAYVAALFVDSQFDFSVVQSFFDRHLKPFFADMTLDAYENFASNHPTTRLSRLLSISFGCSDWRMGARETDTVIPGKGKAIAAMVMIHGKVWFHSLGQGGRYARLRASHAALERLDGLPPYEFRQKYGCDCVEEEGEGEGGLGYGGEGGMLTREKEGLMREALGPSI